MLIRRLKDCDEFVGGDDSILRELLHPDKADVNIRYSLAHATVRPGEKNQAAPAQNDRGLLYPARPGPHAHRRRGLRR